MKIPPQMLDADVVVDIVLLLLLMLMLLIILLLVSMLRRLKKSFALSNFNLMILLRRCVLIGLQRQETTRH